MAKYTALIIAIMRRSGQATSRVAARENEKQRELRHGFGQCSQSNPHDRQSGHRVIEVSSAGSPFGLKTISFLDLSFTYAVCDV